MNGAAPFESNTIFRIVITAMFTIILGMAGYIAANLNRNSDAVIMRIDIEAGRTDRANLRINDIESKLGIIEYRLDHPVQEPR